MKSEFERRIAALEQRAQGKPSVIDATWWTPPFADEVAAILDKCGALDVVLEWQRVDDVFINRENGEQDNAAKDI